MVTWTSCERGPFLFGITTAGYLIGLDSYKVVSPRGSLNGGLFYLEESMGFVPPETPFHSGHQSFTLREKLQMGLIVSGCILLSVIGGASMAAVAFFAAFHSLPW
jgi:hypothetical protein